MRVEPRWWPVAAFALGALLAGVALVALGGGGVLGRGAGEGAAAALIYRDCAPGVVKIVAFAEGDSGLADALGSCGAGFVVDDEGTILTCAHVVSPGGSVQSTVRVVVRDASGSEHRLAGRVEAVDEATDVAVLSIDPRGLELPALPLGDAHNVHVGDRVYVIGHPLDYDFSMSTGIVSAVGRVVRGPADTCIAGCIQTDAAVNDGDSGGPLIDASGRVVGLNEQIVAGCINGIGAVGAPRAAGNIGLAFAVPIDAAVDVLRQVRATGEVRHAWLGIEAVSVTPALAGLLGLPVEAGALIVAVEPDGPFARAGLRGGDRAVRYPGGVVTAGGDIITSVDGRTVTGMADVVVCTQARKPGDVVVIRYLRTGVAGRALVTLGVRPDDP